MMTKYALVDGDQRRPFNGGDTHVEWFDNRYAVVLYANDNASVSAIGYDKRDATWYRIEVENAVDMIREGRWKASETVSLLTAFKMARYYEFDSTLYRGEAPLNVPVSVLRALRIGQPVSKERHTLVGHVLYKPATLYRAEDEWMRQSYSGFFVPFDPDRFCRYDQAIQSYRLRETTRLTMSLLVERFRLSVLDIDYVEKHGRGVLVGYRGDMAFEYVDGNAWFVEGNEAWYVDDAPTAQEAIRKLNGVFRNTYGTYRWLRAMGDDFGLVELRVYAQDNRLSEEAIMNMAKAVTPRPVWIAKPAVVDDVVTWIEHGIEIKFNYL
ncbi:MAG: hypothetical protein D6683_01525 [Actinomyces sp.]|nr:MAG: hypothetical protein D6683_01525 [Actinomyces sp.]